MELRVLRYFLAITREESISRAAEALHVTQPTLSRQIHELEEELGTTLMVRGSRSVTLTQEGMRLRRRAQEIVDLADRTQAEFADSVQEIGGDVHIGAGETHLMRPIARAAVSLRKEYPAIRYHLFSGNAMDIMEKLDSGLLDFGLLLEQADPQKFKHIRISGNDVWGILMRKDDPLAQRTVLRAEDLLGLPLMTSRQLQTDRALADWLGEDSERIEIVGTYNLLFNAALWIEAGMGYALCIDQLIAKNNEKLAFVPLYPALRSNTDLIWKKYQILSPAAELFLQHIQQTQEAEASVTSDMPADRIDDR